jgi:hypothetical protein
MKKTLIKLALFSCSISCGSVLASTVQNTNIPVESIGLGLNVMGLYLQAGANNLQYATYTQPLPAPAPHWNTDGTVKPHFHSAFSVGLQYNFSTRVDQILVDWLHFRSKDSNAISADGSASVAPPYYFGPLAQALFNTSASGNADFDVDNVDFAYAHLFDIGRYLRFEPFAGLNVAYLKEYLDSNYQGNNAGGDRYNISAYNTSKYVGAGPRIGLDTTFYFYKHFGILAQAGASVMAGSMSSNTNFLSQGRDNPTPVRTSLADQTLVKIVVEIESKLGLTYQYAFHSGSSLEVQGGYIFDTYLNGINQVVPTALVADQLNNGVIAIETSAQDQSNLTLNGPYLKVNYLFSV